MSSPIFQAPAYDPRRERRNWQAWTLGSLTALLVAASLYVFWNWPEERVVDKFFERLERQDYEGAYGIWLADSDWKQHPERYRNYPYGGFYSDWGPGGEYGPIRSHKIEASGSPPKGGSGVIVVVTVNGRAEKARIWVEKKDKSLTFSPY